jgi:SNF family Na+-dependent transporter
MEERGQWETRTSFILAAIGSAIGLGNIWRFPYICANNGGGAFLIAFVVALITAGIPILIMELSIGHKLGLVLTWVSIVGCIWKGPETVGKVVYATVLIPWIYCSARVVRAADYRDCRQI